MAWPGITEGTTKATKAFFEAIFANVEALIASAKSSLEGLIGTAKGEAESYTTAVAANLIPTSEKGVPGGVAQLNSEGELVEAQVPPANVSEVESRMTGTWLATAHKTLIRAALGLGESALLTLTQLERLAKEAAEKAEGPAAYAVSTIEVASLSGSPTVDSVTVPVGKNVLLTAQSNTVHNGLWRVETSTWVRAVGFEAATERWGTFIPVTSGTVYAGSTWLLKNKEKVLVETSVQGWEINSAGTGIIPAAKEEAKTATTGKTVLNLAAATIFRLTLKESATTEPEFTNLPTVSTEVIVELTQNATGKGIVKFLNAIQWLGSAPTFSGTTFETASATTVVFLRVINAGTLIVGVASGTLTTAASVPVHTGKYPEITGTLEVGDVLTTTKGEWTNTPTSYAYQWYRNGAEAISGATSSTYTLKEADAGRSLYVTVVATNASGNSLPAESAETGKVKGLPKSPENTVLPAISGTYIEGETLSSTTGTWTESPTSYSYQWKRAGSNISGATSSTYVLQSADVGHTLTVEVGATNATGTTHATSAATPLIAAPETPEILGICPSPDGKYIYVGEGSVFQHPQITVYSRAENGVLTKGETVKLPEVASTTNEPASWAAEPLTMGITPNGELMYVGTQTLTGASLNKCVVYALKRNKTTGALTYSTNFQVPYYPSSFAFSESSEQLYTTYSKEAYFEAAKINATTGATTQLNLIAGATWMVDCCLSPNGEGFFAAGYGVEGGILYMARKASNGELTSSIKKFQTGTTLKYPEAVAATNTNVYFAYAGESPEGAGVAQLKLQFTTEKPELAALSPETVALPGTAGQPVAMILTSHASLLVLERASNKIAQFKVEGEGKLKAASTATVSTGEYPNQMTNAVALGSGHEDIYVLNRASQTITRFHVNATTGELESF